MPDLLRRVQAYSSRHGLWTPDTRIVTAVSGGSDSVALLLILQALAGESHLRLEGVAHLHHGIRGGEADGDAVFVQALAARLGLPCEVGHADVPADAATAGHSLEVAGRRARLAFFAGMLARPGIDRIALAHTRGDQAETVLLRLSRGAGPRGLGGMAPSAGQRIRPLLEIGRNELRQWLSAKGQPWRDDSTNADVAVVRNRLRHEVMPQLTSINPRAEAALARAARILAADAALLDELAAQEADRLIQRRDNKILLDRAELGRLPEALARRVVLSAFGRLDPTRAYGWDETDVVLGPGSRSADVGRLRLERNRELAVLSIRAAATTPQTAPDGNVELALEIPGTANHPAGAWVMEAAGPMAPELAVSPAPNCAVLDASALGRHLTIRGWRPGDRVQPLGLGGRKKLQDVFVDRKIPRAERARVPVVLDVEGRVVWVAGHVVGEPFRVTPHSAAVVVLTLRR